MVQRKIILDNNFTYTIYFLNIIRFRCQIHITYKIWYKRKLTKMSIVSFKEANVKRNNTKRKWINKQNINKQYTCHFNSNTNALMWWTRKGLKSSFKGKIPILCRVDVYRILLPYIVLDSKAIKIFWNSFQGRLW